MHGQNSEALRKRPHERDRAEQVMSSILVGGWGGERSAQANDRKRKGAANQSQTGEKQKNLHYIIYFCTLT